jgi:hypothetical protein
MTVLDIKGASDNTSWPQILKKLKDFNCPRNLYQMINSYLSERYAVIKIGNMVVQTKLTKGLTSRK